MKTLLIAGTISLILSILLGKIFIPILRRVKIGQTVLKYVETHKDKNGTPTMGGLFFVISAVLTFLIFGGTKGRIALVSMTIGVAFLIVGFIDDFIKIKYRQNEGLKAYQKIIFQFAIATVAGVFAYINGITQFNVPFFDGTLNLGWWTIPVVAVIFIAITNSVNLTDGLDGLAGGVSVVYLVFMMILIMLQTSKTNVSTIQTENQSTVLLCSCLVGAVLGFLVYNVSKAKVFMGDTGSLSLGGFLGAVSIFTSNSFFIPIIGIMFVMSSISVIVQVIHFKRTKKRVFLMAPLHHHFQLKGYTETQISFVYSLITAVMGLLSVVFVL
ncbi:MAG: phospho-N-acetylmuramoyl-pentapeptide-transferase [Clostridia bacterium]|nr:phospho-N-acetylmuramoyl-pentapeptide-transferase [Clostridia bacterium]